MFLVALPLCLGFAFASGAPLVSGLVSGIVGGVLVGTLIRSETSVSGPSAGLAAVALASRPCSYSSFGIASRASSARSFPLRS